VDQKVLKKIQERQERRAQADRAFSERARQEREVRWQEAEQSPARTWGEWASETAGAAKDAALQGTAAAVSGATKLVFKAPGMDTSEAMWGHFVDGKGETFEVDPQSMRGSAALEYMMQQNRRDFEQSMRPGGTSADGSKHPFLEQIESMKDGESITLYHPGVGGASDEWNQTITRVGGVWEHLDLDQFGSTGSAQIKSRGNLTATRDGDTVTIQGRVDHNLEDVYNFNTETWKDYIFLPQIVVQESGMGTPFRVEGQVPQALSGTVKVKDGEVVDGRFKWEDAKDK
jgi:hypothetical protein